MKVKKTTLNEQMQKIFHDYQKVNGDGLVDLNDLYDWAIEHDRWNMTRQSARSLFKHQMSRSLSIEKLVEAGSPIRIRINHAVKKEDGTGFLWGDIRTIKPPHMQLSLQNRRLLLAAAAIQHDADTQFYNKHNTYGAQLSFDYNLNADVQEAKQPTEYPDERPKND